MKKRPTLTERMAKKKAENSLQDRSALSRSDPQDRKATPSPNTSGVTANASPQDRSALNQSIPQAQSAPQARSVSNQSVPQDRSTLNQSTPQARGNQSIASPLSSNRKTPVTPNTSTTSGVQDRMATPSPSTSGVTAKASPHAGNRMATPSSGATGAIGNSLSQRPTLASINENQMMQVTNNQTSATNNTRLRHENMIIDSRLPILEVHTLKMIHQLGEHGRLTLI